MIADAGNGWDVATVTVIGTVVCGVITALSVAIVKILGALQELKVAVIKAAEQRVKDSVKLHDIGASTNGNLSGVNKRLDEALSRIDEMQKATAAKVPTIQLPVTSPEDPANITEQTNQNQK